MNDIVIRPLESWEELGDVEALQRAVWGEDPTNIMYRHMLVSIARNGGLILGAYDGKTLIGCSIGFLGTDVADRDRPAMANLKLYSKRMGVLPAYRDRGVGFQLKLAQRDFARQCGIRLITWTFDPLLSRNAYLNVRKLGVTASRFYQDYYGTESEALTLAGSSDRLQADWWITSRRVEERLEGGRGALSLAQYLSAETTILNPTVPGARGVPLPADSMIKPGGLLALVEIPSDYEQIVRSDPGLAHAWRAHSREVLPEVFNRGYVITDFLYEAYEGRQRSFYVLSHDGSPVFGRN